MMEPEPGWFRLINSYFRMKRLFSLLPVLLAACLGLIPGIDVMVSILSLGEIYPNTLSIPHRKVALVLGTSNLLGNGLPSPWFSARMEAAAALYYSGKADYVLASGDNSHESYNEPMRMRNSLIRLGVPEERIILDFAGFSTFDSIVRARQVFGLNQFTVVSQDFQNERALFIARFTGADVIAFSARSVGGALGFNMITRESLARFKAFLDLFYLDTQPRFLGAPVRIE